MKRSDSEDIIAVDPKKSFKIQMPLSEEIEAWVHVFGGTPTHNDLNKLRQAIDLLDLALNGEQPKQVVEKQQVSISLNIPKREVVEEPAPVAKVSKKRGLRFLRKLPPCEKHPDSERSPKTNRCRACENEYADLRHIARFQKMGMLHGRKVVFSQMMKCPGCLLGPIRLRRYEDADMSKDNWIHIREHKGQPNCEVAITDYPHIKTDYAYGTKVENVQANGHVKELA